MTHVDNLTKGERIQAMKMGMKLALAANPIPGFVKVSESWDPIAPVLKVVVGLSLLGGIPLGIAAHMVGRQISSDRSQEKGQLDRVRYYKRLTDELAGGVKGVPNV